MIFSGRPAPKWTIRYSSDRQLCEDLSTSPNQAAIPSRLGYKGFYCSPILSTSEFSKGFVILGAQTKTLQHRLLDSAPPDVVTDELKTRVRKWIDSQ